MLCMAEGMSTWTSFLGKFPGRKGREGQSGNGCRHVLGHRFGDYRNEPHCVVLIVRAI